MQKSKGTRCTVCDQEIKQEESLYSSEVTETAQHFCSTDCRAAHKRKAAPSKQELEEKEKKPTHSRTPVHR